MTNDAPMADSTTTPPLWMVIATFGMGVFAIGYAGFILGSGIPLPLAAGATLCERLAVLGPVLVGIGGVMMIVMGTELREVADA
jgi:hypothetical protein